MTKASQSANEALAPTVFKSRWLYTGPRSSLAGAFVVLAAGLAISGSAYVFTAEQLEFNLRSRFEARAVVALAQIDKRLNDYRNIILGLQGLFLASEKVTRQEFHDYTENLQLRQRLPGLQTIAFQRYLRHSQKADFVAAMRRDPGLQERGYRDFAIYPEGDREEYVVVAYLEPKDENFKVLGVDVSTQPASREPIRRSRDTGQISISAPFTVPQLADSLPRLVLRAPVYRYGAAVDTLEKRRAALEGYVVMIVEADASFREFFGTLVSEGERTIIEDIGPDEGAGGATRMLVFDSGAPATIEASRFSKHATLPFGGRRWDISVRSNEQWMRQLPTRYMPALALAVGAIFSLLLAGLYLALARSQSRAERLALRMTNDLRQSERRLSALAEMSSDWFWETDINDRFTRIAGASTNKNMLPAADILGKSRWEVIPPSETPEQIAAHRQRLMAREPFDIELRLPDADGRAQWLRICGAPRYDENGNFIGYHGTAQDISAAKWAVENIRLEHVFRQTIIESIPGMFYLLDPAGRMLLWNRNFETVSGYSGDEITHMNALDFFDAEHQPLMKERIETVFLRGEAMADAPFVTKSGARIPYYFTGLRMAQEDRPTLIGIGIDISEEKKAQQMMRDINETLEQRVRERTAELEASNQELEAFSYSVSHDLRAPLRALDGFSHLLVEDYAEQLGAEGRSHIKRIRSASQRMGKLIDDLIDLARASRQELNRSSVDLSELANEIRQELQEQTPERKVTWLISDGLTVNADPVQLKLVLENLLRNAWKFSLEQAESRIEFGRLDNAAWPTFYVRDNGAGFEMTYIDKLFKPFQRLHDLKRFEGTGIGLAIVQRILRRHGGRIWAESAPDAGATFYFTIP